MGNGPEFFQTAMGHKFYEGTVPALVRELKRLNDNLEKLVQQGQSAEDARLHGICKECRTALSFSKACMNPPCRLYRLDQRTE